MYWVKTVMYNFEPNGLDEEIKIGILHKMHGYWVSNEGSKNNPSFHVWIPSVTHSIADSAYSNITLAVARCNYLAKTDLKTNPITIPLPTPYE